MAANGKNHRKETHTSRNQYKGVCVRKDLRLAVYLRDDFRCIYCQADLRDAAPFDISLDHLICAADGGSNEPSNMVTACRHCNCSRGDKPLNRFCGPETRQHIRRNTARSIAKYRTMAKSLIAGKTGGEYESK